MKKIIALVLCLVIVFALAGCGNHGQESNANNTNYENGYTVGYKEGYNAGREDGINEGEKQNEVKTQLDNQNCFAQFSGSFTATVEQLLPDYYALPGKTIAVVHFFQDGPFLLRFQEDMTGKLIEGKPYVFEFETFEVAIPDGEDQPSISDYMYSIHVTNYRFAEENEIGLAGKMAKVEIIMKQ